MYFIVQLAPNSLVGHRYWTIFSSHHHSIPQSQHTLFLFPFLSSDSGDTYIWVSFYRHLVAGKHFAVVGSTFTFQSYLKYRPSFVKNKDVQVIQCLIPIVWDHFQTSVVEDTSTMVGLRIDKHGQIWGTFRK